MSALKRFGAFALVGVIFVGLFATSIMARGSVESATSTSPITTPTLEIKVSNSVERALSGSVSEKGGSGTSSTDYVNYVVTESRDKGSGTPQEAPSSFGYTTIGQHSSYIYDSRGELHNIAGSKFVCPSAGAASSITAYIVPCGQYDVHVRFAIYNEDLTLLAQTNVVVGYGIDWCTASFASPPLLNANQTYWLVATANSTYFDEDVYFAYNDGATNQGLEKRGVAWGNFPNPLTSVTYNGGIYSIYCTYTPPEWGVDVSISPSSQSGTPGTTLTYTATVTNRGNVEDTYNLSVSDTLGWTLGISPPILTIPPSKNGQAALIVTIPPWAEPGTEDVITVTATSQTNPSVSDYYNCNCVARVEWDVDVSISPSHQSAPPGGSLTYTVTVTNVGLNPDNYVLYSWDDLGWGLELENDTFLNVPSEASRTTTLTVSIPSDAVSGTVNPIWVTATGWATGVWGYASCTASVVDTTSPPVPQLISPSNCVTLNDNTPTFEWSSVSDPSGVTYTLQYSEDNAFQTATTVENLFDNTYTVPDNEALVDNTYYWRVQAVDDAGNQSGWSDVWQFTVDTTSPLTPTLISPPNNSRLGENTPTFRWTAVSDPSGVTYSIQVDNDPSFSSPEVIVTGLVNNTYHSPTLAYKTYSWRVRAIDGAGNQSGWSEVWRVTLIPKEEPPPVEPPDPCIPPDWS